MGKREGRERERFASSKCCNMFCVLFKHVRLAHVTVGTNTRYGINVSPWQIHRETAETTLRQI